MSPTPQVGRYERIRPIASGGMATVYLGRASGAGGFERNVAIKVMHPHLADDADFVAMFLDEAKMAANLRHPNVVPTLDVVDDESGLFIVMEYIDGVSLQWMLRSLRKAETALPLPVALRIALDLLAGLQAAHDLHAADGKPMRLVHRDVSPQNVLVGTAGIARIMDFGIARAETRMVTTRGGQVKGKVQYMSPEQLQGLVVDHRSDVYAAGIVLWEMLTGRGLFRAENDAAVMHVAAQGVKAPPSAFAPHVPPPIDEICMKALAIAADRRFATAQAFAEALEDAAGAAGVAIATPRAVGQIVSTIPAPRPPRAAPTVGARPDTPAPVSDDKIPERPSAGPTLATGQAITAAGPSAPRRRGPVVMGIAVSTALGALLGLVVYGRSEGDEAETATSRSKPVGAAAPLTEPTSTSPSAKPPPSADIAPPRDGAAMAAPSASASASAPAVAAPPPVAQGGSKKPPPVQAPIGKPPAPPPAKPPGAFNPDEP